VIKNKLIAVIVLLFSAAHVHASLHRARIARAAHRAPGHVRRDKGAVEGVAAEAIVIAA
jgi:hypothetical protein